MKETNILDALGCWLESDQARQLTLTGSQNTFTATLTHGEGIDTGGGTSPIDAILAALKSVGVEVG